jgi:hypothetical protein
MLFAGAQLIRDALRLVLRTRSVGSGFAGLLPQSSRRQAALTCKMISRDFQT